ncbi:MAG: Na/Pi cotransporter family protein [Flavobacteriales bacterium]|nr:Na/Pi cotransporter family protein [Flavobacteriales bacterium]
MEFGFISVLTLIGALGFFIYGMKIMSEGIQKAAGGGLRKMLNIMTRNKFMGVLTGFIVTSIIQSSSATTVMTVSFVNAGLLTLMESAGVMLGANIGTTITSWLVALLGFKVSMSALSLPLIAFAVPMLFVKNTKVKYIGEFVLGFALLFWGLEELKNSVPDVKNNPELLHFLGDFANTNFFSNILFVIVGTLLTIIVQSSSATIALTQTLCFTGIIPFEAAIAMVLGENIGTTITAELASIPANVHAKRSARIHSLFNIIGVGWMVLVISFTPFLEFLSWIGTEYLKNPNPMVDVAGTPMGLAIFHTTFNALNVSIMIWVLDWLVKLATKTVKSKGELDEEYHLEHIKTGITTTPEISIFEAQREIAKFGELTKRMNGFVKEIVSETDSKKLSLALARIKKYEDITDKIETEVANYLTKVSQGQMSDELSLKIRGMLRIIVNLERIGDIYYQMSKTIERKHENKIWFTPDQRKNTLEMFDLVNSALDNMLQNLNSEYEHVTLTKAREFEDSINNMRTILRKEHFKNVEKGEYDFKSATAYSELYNALEKVGDHIINVSEGVLGIQ